MCTRAPLTFGTLAQNSAFHHVMKTASCHDGVQEDSSVYDKWEDILASFLGPCRNEARHTYELATVCVEISLPCIES